ncbi:Retrotransposon protein, Ty3-gypsy subclass, partial [Phytophthora palmivora]
MMRSVRAYVKSCETCQRTKARNTKPPGLLQSQPIPRGRWTHVAMDFIVSLPMTRSKSDAVLVVVDQLTKRAHFVTCKGTATAREGAELYRDRIFALHGVPLEILSDRDPKFTATVWTTLCTIASDRMSEYYDANRPVQSFDVGEGVLLSTENLANYHAGTTKAKLGARWIGPYAIVSRLGHDYYELKLPQGVKFHPVFHTSYLKPYIRSNGREQRTFKVLLPDNTEGELVEDIVDFKRTRGKAIYKVKWLGQARCTWEPLANLKY